MTHWLQLALFLFCYAFIGFFVLPGPVSIFFLLGLFILGIQNQMYYNVNVILLVMMMLYMVCAMQIISIYFPFTSKPERLYSNLRQRFFHACARMLQSQGMEPGVQRWFATLMAGNSAVLLAKMHTWGGKIDPVFFTANGQQQVTALNKACDLLHAQIQVLLLRQGQYKANPLIASVRSAGHPGARLCETLACNPDPDKIERAFNEVEAGMADIEGKLDQYLTEERAANCDQEQLAQFYVFLNLQASILDSISNCRNAQQALDWHQLAETRF